MSRFCAEFGRNLAVVLEVIMREQRFPGAHLALGHLCPAGWSPVSIVASGHSHEPCSCSSGLFWGSFQGSMLAWDPGSVSAGCVSPHVVSLMVAEAGCGTGTADSQSYPRHGEQCSLPLRSRDTLSPLPLSPQFQTELRKILLSLIEVAQKLLALSPGAVELFTKANGTCQPGGATPTYGRQLPHSLELELRRLLFLLGSRGLGNRSPHIPAPTSER